MSIICNVTDADGDNYVPTISGALPSGIATTTSNNYANIGGTIGDACGGDIGNLCSFSNIVSVPGDSQTLNYTVRNKDPEPFICPFIFTQATPDGPWVEQGTILTNQVGKANEKTQTKEISAFSGKIKIKEIDPETSYTDYLAVHLYHGDGTDELLLPLKPELRAIDSNYFITNQGDEVVIDFEAPSDPLFIKAEVIAHGFYETYK
jgi:hypothetical protein